MKVTQLALSFLPVAIAFSPVMNSNQRSPLKAAFVSDDDTMKPIFDPLGLYPENSPERLAGLIEPLESNDQADKRVFDPLGIYTDKSQVSTNVKMSASLPFVPRPALLDGSIPGDRGFDPFNFAADANALQWYRSSEIKHARLAMLAAVGWPLAELFHKGIASTLNLPVALASEDRVPSVLNDGLSHVPITFLLSAVAAAAILESFEGDKEITSCKLNPGDYDFDPLQLGGKTEAQQLYMQEAEVFNGRLAMLAITGFAIQEWWLNSAVVDQIPILFKPMNVALEQVMAAGGMSV